MAAKAPMENRRLDKWLWYARFFKSRSLASKFCASGKLRLNETVIKKAHHGVHVGDVLTFPKGPHIRVIRVAALGTRRGPADEAQTLYEDLDPP
ncbi:MAG: RNA-binding S4 domain-containing protein, partial [Alphaproteobacteria bacterium]|nr:RNA-binding S4 domain-containing protein [Alphaproteobacteria bacterium]